MWYRIRKFRANNEDWYAAEYRRGLSGSWREYTGCVSRSWDACYAYLETKATAALLQVRLIR